MSPYINLTLYVPVGLALVVGLLVLVYGFKSML